VGYSNWPPDPGDTASNDLTFGPVGTVMQVSLRWAADRYPPVRDGRPGETYTEPFAINLPAGISPRTYWEIAKYVGPSCTPMIEGQDVPTYHIVRVNVRGTSATVELIRPVLGMGGQGLTDQAYQRMTLNLQGGISPWKVTSHRLSPVGLVGELPEENRLGGTWVNPPAE
jgi:hypothetical protein